MSFSADVKNELLDFYDINRHCNIAELSAFLNYNASFSDKEGLVIHSENRVVLNKYVKILADFFDITLSENNGFIIADEKQINRVLKATGLCDENGKFKKMINPLIVSSVCCKRAYIRGAFICSGSLCNPEKNYHLEFVDYDYDNANMLMNLINSFEIESKLIQRKSHYVLYVKEGEQIVDLLNIMNAHISLMNLENVRIIKDVRNNVNRIVNCETANLNKIVSAGVKQREDIEYIHNTIGINRLPQQLLEVAEIRLELPEASLKEIGEMLTPKVGKSGVNHRFKKIHIIAENLKEEHYDDRANYKG